MIKYWKTFINQSEKTAEIILHEQIGKDYLSEDGISSKQFAEDIKALGDVDRIIIRINSPGGSVFEGLAIYNILKAHTAEKIVYVDGVAASIASAVAMAGDKVIMPENTMLMIHDPHALAVGDAELMRKMADTLDKTAESLVTIYRDKCKQPRNVIREKMKAETWFTAAEALEFGLCDEITESIKIVAHFDFSKFINTPKELLALTNAKQADVMHEGRDTFMHNNDGSRLAEVNVSVVEVRNLTKTKKEKEVKQMDALEVKKQRDLEISEMLTIAEKHNAIDLAKRFIKEGKSKAEFVEAMLTEKYNAKPVDAATTAFIGMSEKEKRQYSLLRAIRGMWLLREEGKSFDGLEKEASDAVAKLIGRNPNGFFLPEDIMTFNPQAIMQVGDPAKGGYTVATEILTGEMVELLRNKTYVARLGARQLSGLVGNIAIPRVTGGATAYWLPETGTVTPSDQAFGQIALMPHRLVASTAYTKELLIQSSINVEAFIRDDLMATLAIALDFAAIAGTGTD
jgi:ATP-dependent Clp protease protease subunit